MPVVAYRVPEPACRSTGRATSELHARVVGAGSGIIASETLPAGLMDDLLPRRRVMGETRRAFNDHQASPDGERIVLGGRMGYFSAPDSAVACRHLADHLHRLFPQLRGVKISHAWSGRIPYTADQSPHIGGRDRDWYALGYCGTGVSRSTWFGHKLASKMLDADRRTAFGDLDFRAFPLPAVGRRMVPLVEAVYRLQDRLRL